MEAIIIWLVLWVVFAFAGAWLAYVVSAFGGVGIAALTDRVWIAPIGVAIGWVLAVAWFVFAIIRAILMLVELISLIQGG